MYMDVDSAREARSALAAWGPSWPFPCPMLTLLTCVPVAANAPASPPAGTLNVTYHHVSTRKADLTFVSVPGRRKSMKRAIVGMQQCQATLLCVSATKHVDELKRVQIGYAAMARDRTRSVGVAFEHLLLASAFGAARHTVVAITKIDEREDAEVRASPTLPPCPCRAPEPRILPAARPPAACLPPACRARAARVAALLMLATRDPWRVLPHQRRNSSRRCRQACVRRSRKQLVAATKTS